MFSHAPIILCGNFNTTKISVLGNVRAARLRCLALPFGSEKISLRVRPPRVCCLKDQPQKVSLADAQQISFTKILSLGQARVRATIIHSRHTPGNSYLLRTRSGTGEKTSGSSSQAGHGAAKRCAKEEVYRLRFRFNQQTGKCRIILRSPANTLEKFFGDTRFCDEPVLFAVLPRRTQRV